MLYSVQAPFNRIWMLKHFRDEIGLPLLQVKKLVDTMCEGGIVEVPLHSKMTQEKVDFLNRMGVTVAVAIDSDDELEREDSYWDRERIRREKHQLEYKHVMEIATSALERQDGELALEALDILMHMINTGQLHGGAYAG